MKKTDWQLIEACRRGDQQAWEEIVERYERLVYSIALNFGLGREDAADIAQNTFIILLENLSSIKEDGNLAGWLGTVARRHTWRQAERRRRDPAGDEEEAVNMPDMDAAERQARWERMLWLQHGLSHLDDRCRRLLEALYFDAEELSYAEVAARLGTTAGSIGPTRGRCLEKLKEILQ